MGETERQREIERWETEGGEREEKEVSIKIRFRQYWEIVKSDFDNLASILISIISTIDPLISNELKADDWRKILPLHLHKRKNSNFNEKSENSRSDFEIRSHVFDF